MQRQKQIVQQDRENSNSDRIFWLFGLIPLFRTKQIIKPFYTKTTLYLFCFIPFLSWEREYPEFEDVSDDRY